MYEFLVQKKGKLKMTINFSVIYCGIFMIHVILVLCPAYNARIPATMSIPEKCWIRRPYICRK